MQPAICQSVVALECDFRFLTPVILQGQTLAGAFSPIFARFLPKCSDLQS